MGNAIGSLHSRLQKSGMNLEKEREQMKTKKFLGALSVVATAALLISSTPAANAAWVPAAKAKVGDDCIRAGATAPGRGVDGSALTCTVVTLR